MTHDVIVVGGSYAGMAAALQLLRARRSVLVIDAGERRNRFADHSHGFLGQDGADPAVIAATARDQLRRYPTLDWHAGKALTARGERDDFTVATDDGGQHRGRRLILALGVTDELPALPGLAERWGKSVFLCPYCHAYELPPGPIGVIATAPISRHQAEMVHEWGPVTFFTNGACDPDQPDLLRRGIVIDPTPVAAIEGGSDLRLADGRLLSFSGLFIASRHVPASTLWSDLGCAAEELATGVQLRTDSFRETSVPGVFACGDVARSPHSLSLAVGDGAWAGGMAHRSLVFPD